MDVHRLDAFARTLAAGTTRRAFLRILTRGGAGALAGLGVTGQAAAQPTGSDSGETSQPVCDPIACPAGQVFSETECACVCDVVCRPNFRPDPTTCICYCTLGDFHVCDRPDQVYDDGACACVCANEECPGDAVLDPETCACYCPDSIACEPGETVDPTTCECVCGLTCEHPLVLDDCECVCGIAECDPGFVFDETACACTCEAEKACTAPKLFDDRVCDCVCDPNIRCTRGKVVDPETCGCVCPTDNPCPTGQVMNPESCLCGCEEPVVCAAPQVADPEACTCVCPPEEACPAPLVKDPETCRCACPTGTGLCNDACVGPCLPTETYNADCECEPIVCPPDRVLTCTCACPPGMAECDGLCLPACGPNQVFDGACRCACRPNITCAEGWIPDPTTCDCVCGLTGCPAGKVIDERRCACVCPPNQSCLTGQTLNPETCRCECGPAPCPTGKVKNNRCRCVCPTDIACQPGETLDPETCACRCVRGSLLERVRVPCSGASVVSSTVLRAGVTYVLRASGTCRLGPNNTGDAEYAFQTINPANPVYIIDKCSPSGIDLGIGVNDPTVDGSKTPHWGAYSLSHVYTTGFTGNGAPITLNYHDCYFPDNQGELTVEILCPGAPVREPTDTGGGGAG